MAVSKIVSRGAIRDLYHLMKHKIRHEVVKYVDEIGSSVSAVRVCNGLQREG